MDYRKMYDDKEHLYAYDLEGRERTLEIAQVTAGELTGEKNRKSKKPMVTFVGEKKKLALNKTNGKTVAQLYGKDTDRWVGQFITIYPTTTEFGGETVDCIRVRPQRPDVQRSSGDRKSNGPRTGRSAKEPALSGAELIAAYEACRTEDRMAELKAARGAAWDRLDAATRETVLVAAKAAKERIDAAASGPSAAGDDAGATSDLDDPDEDEASEIARIEREQLAKEGARG